MKRNVYLLGLLSIILSSGLNSFNIQEEDAALTIEPVKTTNAQRGIGKYLNTSYGCLVFNASDKDPMISIFNPDQDQIKLLKLGYVNENNKNAHVKSEDQFENISVLEETITIYSANIRIKNKFQGARESVIARTFEKIFLPEETYPGKILIDEYNATMPMFWVLKNEAQLSAIKSYFINNATPTAMKPILLIKVLDTKDLTALTQENQVFLSRYFNVFSIDNKYVKEFFDKSKERMQDLGFNVTSPNYKGETVTKAIFRDGEKKFNDGKIKDIAIVIGGILFIQKTSGFINKELLNPLLSFFSAKSGIDDIVYWLKDGSNDYSPQDTVVDGIISKLDRAEESITKTGFFDPRTNVWKDTARNTKKAYKATRKQAAKAGYAIQSGYSSLKDKMRKDESVECQWGNEKSF